MCIFQKKSVFSYIYKNKTKSKFLLKTHSFSSWKLKSKILIKKSHQTFFIQSRNVDLVFLNGILTLDQEFDMVFVASH